MSDDCDDETPKVPSEVLSAIESMANGEFATKDDLARVLKFDSSDDE